jgi:hypothetical protein
LIVSFTIPGAPRTKKTSNRLVPFGAHGHKILPSKAFEDWNARAQMEIARMRSQLQNIPRMGIGVEVNCRALFYRDALIGDATGYYQALADCLQEARIIENDRLIVSWDGSRLLKDASQPRVKVTLEAVTDAQP